MSSIHTLPPTTAKLLTATQTITTPLSIAKELLENALDARATSISIEISANTLDVLQVRDNGHGIAPEGRAICCRRHTTSKLGKIEDLRSVGRRSLGFRGEALFAAKQVAAGMEVVTRVEGEAVAVKVGIGREGEVVRYAFAQFSRNASRALLIRVIAEQSRQQAQVQPCA
jgi:DNA mismatch repair ATPase MutL